MANHPKKVRKPRVRRPKRVPDTGPITWSSKVRLSAVAATTSYTGVTTISKTSNIFDKTRVSVRNPKWKTQVASGQQAGTPFTASEVKRTVFEDGFTTVTVSDGNLTKPVYYTESFAGALGYSVNAPNHISGRTSSADNEALKRTFAAIKQQQQNFAGLAFLGEFRESLKMILRPASALRDAVSKYSEILTKRMNGAISRGQSRRQRKRELLNAATGSWLEASFGWAPLISDIKGLAETAARFQYDFRHAEVRGYGKTDWVFDFADDTIHLANYLNGTAKQRDRTRHLVVYRVGISASNTSDFGSIGRLVELSGFNLNDFLPTVWELTPWSFLVDYFTNIGDIVTAYSTGTAGIKWVNKSDILSTTRSVNITSTLDDMKRQLGSNVRNVVNLDGRGFGRSEVVRKDVVRSQPSTLPMPTLEFSLPGSAFKWANTVALGVQQDRKLLKLFR